MAVPRMPLMPCTTVGPVLAGHRAPSVMDIRLNGIGWRKDHVVTAGETATLDFDCPLCEEQESS